MTIAFNNASVFVRNRFWGGSLKIKKDNYSLACNSREGVGGHGESNKVKENAEG